MILKGIRRKGTFRFLIIDLIMVVLLVVNLGWIIFDWLYSTNAVQNLLAQWTPAFESWYGARIHPHFILIDLAFVAVFLLDFIIGWIVAAAQQVYHRWFFYPFVHWYDLLGCIPVAGFRFLRLLRIVTIVYRLHRAGIIDLSDSGLSRTAAKYYAILVEEVSDRVVVKMISDLQVELRSGSPVMEKIVSEVIRPQKTEIVEWMSHRVERVASKNYEQYQNDVESYVNRRVNDALQANQEFARLSQVPIAGPMIRDATERAISDMVSNVTQGVLQDIASERNKPLLDEAAEIIFNTMLDREEDSELSRMVVETLDRSLEIVKKQVNIQQWKLKERAQSDEHLRQLVREELQRLDTT